MDMSGRGGAIPQRNEYVCVLENSGVEFGNGFEVVWPEEGDWVE